MNAKITTVDEYIANYPEETQEILQKLRTTISKEIPGATEKMSYGIPTYWKGRNIVHFGALPNHIGFYPGSQAIVDFADELTEYTTSKGTVQFPLDKPIPYDFIAKMTAHCAKLAK